MTDDAHPRSSKGLAFAHVAFILSVLAALYLLGIMMATHLGYIGTDLGFKTLTLGVGPRLALAALVISGLSLLISIFRAPVRHGMWALAAVLVSGGLMGGFYIYERALKTFPPIADVATDWDRPLTFSDKLVADRGKTAKTIEDFPRVPRNESMEWGGKTVGAINQLTCPGAKTIRNKRVTEDQIVDLLRAEHYAVFGHAPWRIEGTYQDNFYGFKSDVVVRIDPDQIDVRSVSREDMPDVGANCRRVTNLINKIRAL